MNRHPEVFLSTSFKESIPTLKLDLKLLKTKGWAENAVRFELANDNAFELRVMSYYTGKWLPMEVCGTLNGLYKFVRKNLEWDGPIQIVEAA